MSNVRRVVVYDANPGPGLGQWGLKTSWAIAARLQRLFGAADAVYGATSWTDAVQWLAGQPGRLSIQYWGHGNPGFVWLAGDKLPPSMLVCLRGRVELLWFRTCSTFQGLRGMSFADYVAKLVDGKVAGHTRIIGLFQGGLHSHLPGASLMWPAGEGEPNSILPGYLTWGPRTVFCLATKIPDGW